MPPNTSLAVSYRLRAHVDAGAVAHNLQQLRMRLGVGPRIWATAKADAYGHGLLRILSGLREADGISVQTLADAHLCRRAGWRGPILIHAGLLGLQESPGLTLPGLHFVISDNDQLNWLARARPAEPPMLWLRFRGDTNMAGFDDASYGAAHAQASALVAQGHACGIGHFNHFARAEEADGIDEAVLRFRRVIAGLPGPVSTCNSAAILRHGAHAATTDWARPGIALYGVSPLPDLTGASLGLRPAMTLAARLLSIQRLSNGSSLGYGGAFVAAEAMTVGLVACGYADGYPRHAGTGTPVLVAGQRSRVLGRPCMDTLAIDLSNIRGAVPGTPVTLWGEGLPVEQVAASAGTIAAQLLTGLTARVPVSDSHCRVQKPEIAALQ